jgi:hypothetical protein
MKKKIREEIIKEIREMKNTWNDFNIKTHSGHDVWEVLKWEIISKLQKKNE